MPPTATAMNPVTADASEPAASAPEPARRRDLADDLEILAFAGAEIELRERVASLESDVQSYRELAAAAIAALHDLTLERDRLRRAFRAQQREFRDFRERVMFDAGAVA